MVVMWGLTQVVSYINYVRLVRFCPWGKLLVIMMSLKCGFNFDFEVYRFMFFDSILIMLIDLEESMCAGVNIYSVQVLTSSVSTLFCNDIYDRMF